MVISEKLQSDRLFMTDMRDYIDSKFDMVAEKMGDLTIQVRELAQAVIKITALEERQRSSDHTNDKRVTAIEGRVEKLEKAHTESLIDSAKKNIYFIAINLILTGAVTTTIAVIVNKLIK